MDQSRSRRTLACHYNLQRDIPPAGKEISHVTLWMVGSRCNWPVHVCWIGRASCSSCSAVLLLWLLCVAPCVLTEYAPVPKDMRWHDVVCHPSSRHLISRFASCVPPFLHCYESTISCCSSIVPYDTPASNLVKLQFPYHGSNNWNPQTFKRVTEGDTGSHRFKPRALH